MRQHEVDFDCGKFFLLQLPHPLRQQSFVIERITRTDDERYFFQPLRYRKIVYLN